MNTFTYTLTLRERFTGTMRKVTSMSAGAASTFDQLGQKSKSVEDNFKTFGNSITSLKSKMDLLRQERDLIDPKNISTIRQYNSEIAKLSKEVDKLENTKGGNFKSWLQDLSGNIPSFLKNPYTLAAAAVGYGTKQALSFDEGMAKVNITARVEGEEFEQLKKRVQEIAAVNKADVTAAPEALNQIISQTGDLDLSLSILDATMKGAKSQFADMDVVAGALAQTLSLVGKENTTAAQVLDTFIAAKRAGAGEFTDFAQYMPSLVAAGDAVGVKYQEVAGLFSYMTGKGLRPERASVMMTNAFNMLGRSEVTNQMKTAGIKVYDDQGNLRSTLDIMREMQGVMGNMTDQQKSLFLENLGISDKQSKQAFMVLTADTEKLSRTLEEVRNSVGETDRALAFSANTTQRMGELWNAFKGRLTEVGIIALPVINTGLTVLNYGLEGIVALVDAGSRFFSAWFGALQNGTPWVWGLTTAVTAAATIYGIHTLALKAHAIGLTTVNLWNKLTAASTGVLTGALNLLKTAFLTTPWGWVALGIGAIAGAVAGLSNKTQKVTKDFAAFNTELRNTQRETRESFEAAMQATEGEQQRADAIQRINDKYGEYLPYLLTEKSTNDELATALAQVNSKLEEKIRLKFKEQAIERLQRSLQTAEDRLFNKTLKGLPAEQQQKGAKILREAVDQYMAGEITHGAFFDRIQTARGKEVTHGLGQVATANSYGAHFVEAFKQYAEQMGIVRVQYSDPKETPSVTTNNVYNYSSTWNGSSWMQQEPYTIGPTLPEVPAVGTPGINEPVTTGEGLTQTQIEALIKKLGEGKGSGGSSKSSSTIVDLNKLSAANLSGTTTYKAVVSKLLPRTLSSLAAANGSATGTDPQEDPRTVAPGMEPREPLRPRLALNKFCDSIIVNIANAEGESMEEITRKIEQTVQQFMRECLDDYQA